ncbi:autophagy-related protein 16-1 [Schistosoma bovis]|uniref:Autophagy-related protein 16-1 n=1 Tax=Schistosoma bovis TaxID=6184 RepID=A0A430Q9D9_SCHBO|nr:autophagy-related protein 16-1 [Schistosoma bovis]
MDKEGPSWKDAILTSLLERDIIENDCSDKPLPCKSALPRNVAVKIDANENEVNSVRFTPSGHIFGSAGFDRKLRLWTYLNGIHFLIVQRKIFTIDCSDKPLPCKSALPRNVAVKIDANENEVNSVRFTPSGHIFGSAGFDRKLRLWTYLNGIHFLIVQRKIFTISGYCSLRMSILCYRPSGATGYIEETAVLGASSDFSCRVWTLNDSRLRVNLTGHSERVISAKFMRSANRVVTASSDRTIKHLRIWDERSGENTGKILLSGRITGMDISSDFTTVLSCTRNNTLEIVDLRMNQVTQCLKADGFQTGLDIVRPCFSPDSDYVAAGGHDGGVYIWSTVSGNLEICLRDHTNIVVCCHWNPNARMPTGDKQPEKHKKESIIDLNKYIDKRIRVKFSGGREAVGILKGCDNLQNMVIDCTTEFLRDPDDPHRLTEDTRELALVVCRGPSVELVCPADGMESIPNPFVQQE